MLVDTHAHLFDERYGRGIERVIARARASGVERIIIPGLDLTSSGRTLTLARQYPGICYAAVGIHPEETVKDTDSQVLEVRQLIYENRKQVIAIGEVGIDLNTDELKQKLTEQQELLKSQCELALEFDLPIIVHTRESVTEALVVLEEVGVTRAQFHCFAGTEPELGEVLGRGYYVSFGGNVSWSKRVRRLTTLVPAERLLLETDSPYMTPRNAKGEVISLTNEPANVKIIAEIIAKECRVETQVLSERTTQNVKELFGI